MSFPHGFRRESRPRVIFIVGPTGAGKSEIAFKLAQTLGGEIISADSMQVYWGMDIGTAKTSVRLRKKIPHYLIDIVSPASSFSAFRFRQLALKALRKICAKGKVPIVAGGSGLYVRALLEGISEQPGPNPTLRKELSKIAKDEGLLTLYHQLQAKSPEKAAKIKSTDQKRIIRALEILDSPSSTTHVSFQNYNQACHSRMVLSEIQREKSDISLKDLGFDPVVIGITKDRSELYADIEKRVEAMFRQGLVREVEKLRRGRMSKTAREAIGYREILRSFPHGLKRESKPSREALLDAKALIKRNTRRFAKRQLTWFKREQGIQWFTRSAGETLDVFCSRILG